MDQGTTDRILFALFCLSRDTRHIDAAELARAAAVRVTQAAEALVSLERAGLVDASRARLTMLGLARAARLAASGGGQPRVDLRHAKPGVGRTGVASPLAAATLDREHSDHERGNSGSGRSSGTSPASTSSPSFGRPDADCSINA